MPGFVKLFHYRFEENKLQNLNPKSLSYVVEKFLAISDLFCIIVMKKVVWYLELLVYVKNSSMRYFLGFHTDQPLMGFVFGTWNLIKNCLSLLWCDTLQEDSYTRSIQPVHSKVKSDVTVILISKTLIQTKKFCK